MRGPEAGKLHSQFFVIGMPAKQPSLRRVFSNRNLCFTKTGSVSSTTEKRYIKTLPTLLTHWRLCGCSFPLQREITCVRTHREFFSVVRKTALFEAFMYKNEHFTKTGSGQACRELRKEWRLPQEGGHMEGFLDHESVLPKLLTFLAQVVPGAAAGVQPKL